MPSYRLDVLEPPNERLRHRREFVAPNDREAVEFADKFYDDLLSDTNVKLDRYVLYEGERVVRERVGTE